jgi:hypothetical protein
MQIERGDGNDPAKPETQGVTVGRIHWQLARSPDFFSLPTSAPSTPPPTVNPLCSFSFAYPVPLVEFVSSSLLHYRPLPILTSPRHAPSSFPSIFASPRLSSPLASHDMSFIGCSFCHQTTRKPHTPFSSQLSEHDLIKLTQHRAILHSQSSSIRGVPLFTAWRR